MVIQRTFLDTPRQYVGCRKSCRSFRFLRCYECCNVPDCCNILIYFLIYCLIPLLSFRTLKNSLSFIPQRQTFRKFHSSTHSESPSMVDCYVPQPSALNHHIFFFHPAESKIKDCNKLHAALIGPSPFEYRYKIADRAFPANFFEVRATTICNVRLHHGAPRPSKILFVSNTATPKQFTTTPFDGIEMTTNPKQ